MVVTVTSLALACGKNMRRITLARECVVCIAAASMYFSVRGKRLWALRGFDGEHQTGCLAEMRDLGLRRNSWMYV